jgi:outer membrane protein OmpA-like peptidoglycan-associated protein
VQKDLYLIKIEVGETLQLNNVFFEQGKPVLKSESYPELDRLFTILNDNPKIHIELAGHTDNVGPAAALLKLSQDRVEAVKKYLEGKGIATGRITGKGYGASQPKEKNDTEEHKRANRRVEFKILKN